VSSKFARLKKGDQIVMVRFPNALDAGTVVNGVSRRTGPFHGLLDVMNCDLG
jgi:hypothetical protein